MHRQPVFAEGRFHRRHFPDSAGFRDPDWTARGVHLPVAERLCEEAIWLPQNVLLGDERDALDVVESVARIRDQADALRRADIPAESAVVR